MKKYLFLLINCCTVAVFSCMAGRTYAQTPQQPAVSDTSAETTVDSTTTADSLDFEIVEPSIHNAHLLLQKLDSQKISDFTTFSAKAKINSNALPVPVTASIRIKKDSIIWVSLTANVVISMEVARAEITRDSVLVMDKLHKTITRRSIAYLQTLLKLPFSFDDVQNIILGNPLMTQDSVLNIVTPDNVRWRVTTGNGTLKNRIESKNYVDTTKDTISMKTYIDLTSRIILTSNFVRDSSDTANIRRCGIHYHDYQPTNNGKYFSQMRDFTASDKDGKLNGDLQFLNFDFDKPLDFPFNIPDSYSEK